MKKIVIIASVLCIVMFAGNAYGQKVQEKEKGIEIYGEKRDPQGNAYGKNKDGLEGKEFGQARAAEAKAARHARAKRAKAHRRAMGKLHR